MEILCVAPRVGHGIKPKLYTLQQGQIIGGGIHRKLVLFIG
jgi:hypothetical protein